MTTEACVIKGNRHGLLLSVMEGAPFVDVLAQLRAKLSAHREFFQGAVVRLQSGSTPLTDEQIQQLSAVVQEFGMTFDGTAVAPSQPVRPAETTTAHRREEPLDDTKLVRRTLRSGQSIHYSGNVVIMGDVNPGSEVVASGDILVLGALRGVAHAGAEGNAKAVVFAFRLEPTQLRIAHFISRAPDEKGPHPTGPELAQVVENLIQIKPYEKTQ